jgi:hypothetical protein
MYNLQINLADYGSHSYWGVWMDNHGSSSANNFATYSLQFYAWQPKGNVPVMTSDTAPYGTAIASAEITPAWKAFDGDPNTYWQTNTTDGSYLAYKFTNPVCAKRLYIANYAAAGRILTFAIQASNDGSTWVDVDSNKYSYTNPASGGKEGAYLDFNNDSYYLYYRVAPITFVTTVYITVGELQFYGRELSVSVPAMATNTTPYGVAIYSSEFSTNGAWHAFDNDGTTIWGATLAATNNYVGYEFNNLTKLSMVDVLFRQGVSSSGYFVPERTFKVQGYTNGEWVDIGTITVPQSSTTTTTKRIILDTISDNACEKFRIFCADALSNSGANWTLTVCSLRFYGLDYSEREFEEGTNKKWLYDHGVELETLNDWNNGAGSVTRTPQSIVLNDASSSGTPAIDVHMDLTDYSLVRAHAGGIYTSGYAIIFSQYEDFSHTIGGYALFTDPPHGISYTITSVNELVYLWISQASNASVGNMEITEWWLE